MGNARSEFESIFRKSPLSNPFLLTAVIAALSLHVAALYLPLTQFVLRVEPLDLAAWVRMIAVAATILLAIEVHKWLRPGAVRAGRMRADRPAGTPPTPGQEERQ